MTQFNHRIQLVSLMALSFAMPALAQSPPATPAQPASGPQSGPARDADVIVVTANKREESVQDIAVAVTALTSERRDELGLTSVQEFTNFAPGLTYSTANDRVGMRGISRSTNNFGIRSGISNYVDGVYYSSSVPGSREPIFVDRVEVVRGPQGTLYGRDSIGGALNVVSKRPTDTFHAQVDLGVGNYQSNKIEALISGPITDSLRYLVGGSRSSIGEGWMTNKAGGPTEGNRRDDYFVTGALSGNLGEKLDWYVRASSGHFEHLGQPGARTSAGIREPYDTRLSVGSTTQSPNSGFGFVQPGSVIKGGVTSNPTVTDKFAFAASRPANARVPQESEIAVGSSRVDLQACKLEYSIVSPK